MIPSCLQQNGCREPVCRCRAHAVNRDTGPEYQPATVSVLPGTGNSAAGGWDCRRSDRPWAGVMAVHRRSAMARDRRRAGRWPDERCRHRPPCHRAATVRSRVCPSIAAAQGSGPGMFAVCPARCYSRCLQARQYTVCTTRNGKAFQGILRSGGTHRRKLWYR